MATRRTSRHGLPDIAWRYLNLAADEVIDEATLSEGESWDLSMLEYDHFDHEYQYQTSSLWAEYGPEITAEWITRHPGTRPYCWWKYSSGLKCRVAPMKVSERWTISNWTYSLRESIPEDQRAWLQEHGHLQEGES